MLSDTALVYMVTKTKLRLTGISANVCIYEVLAPNRSKNMTGFMETVPNHTLEVTR